MFISSIQFICVCYPPGKDPGVGAEIISLPLFCEVAPNGLFARVRSVTETGWLISAGIQPRIQREGGTSRLIGVRRTPDVGNELCSLVQRTRWPGELTKEFLSVTGAVCEIRRAVATYLFIPQVNSKFPSIITFRTLRSSSLLGT